MLTQIRKVQLPDRPFHTSVSGDGRRFTACSPPGKCRFFDNDLRLLDEIDLGAGVDWVQLDESGSLLLSGLPPTSTATRRRETSLVLSSSPSPGRPT